MLGMLLAAVGCVVSEPVGGVADTDAGGGSSETGLDESDGPGQSDGAEADVCADNPASCQYACGDDECGGPLSQYDDDGCLRTRCDDSQACPDGRSCIRLGDYGACAPTNWSCDESDGMCSCGGPKDCFEGASVCIPDALVPELAELVPTVEEFAQMCGAVTSQAACGEAPSFYDAEQDLSMWCTWRTWVPVALGAGDVCEFGGVVEQCGIATASEAGCGDAFASCDTGPPALARTNEAGQLEVSTASGCSDFEAEAYCSFSGGELVEGDPACICLCDPAFPT